ncbi:MAG: ribosome recycling factor [Dethiosulfovibrio peptidovorans]|nr:MAG: ribosome recycling factor [Dethiosulfovibrio peptidovorans]
MSDITTFNLEKKMEKAVEHLKGEFVGIRTGRAHPGLISDIKVDYYGSSTPLKQMATISVPEGRTLVVTPFDKTAMKDVEKAILASDLGVTPQNDGQVIRLNLPELTGERRKELSKMVHKLSEEARVAVRNLRRDCNDFYKKQQGAGDISEDQYHDFLDKIQKITDDHIGKVDAVMKEKEEEIMTKF